MESTKQGAYELKENEEASMGTTWVYTTSAYIYISLVSLWKF